VHLHLCSSFCGYACQESGFVFQHVIYENPFHVHVIHEPPFLLHEKHWLQHFEEELLLTVLEQFFPNLFSDEFSLSSGFQLQVHN